MKVVAINGSARRDGNTAVLLREVLSVLEAEGIETELIQLGGKRIEGCTVCLKCRDVADGRCHGRKDLGNECIEAMMAADGILLGSPVYFSDITPEMKALIDRAGYASRRGGNWLARKVGAGVVAVRRAGAMHALDSINHFFLISEMVVPGSSYWNLGIGGAPGEVSGDEEGLKTMRTLGQNMAWVMARLAEQ
jgi:multimeric flavodoxin WrbA